jgi:hypothetical protein
VPLDSVSTATDSFELKVSMEGDIRIEKVAVVLGGE